MTLAKIGFSPLYLVDREKLGIENIVRHHLGASAVDQFKASAMAAEIETEFPLCQVNPIDKNFVEIPYDEQVGLVQEVDVVVAAADDTECQQHVNKICLDTGATAVFPGVWVDPESGVRDGEAGEILWYRAGGGMPCYLCSTSWRPLETGANARGGTKADIDVLALATAAVVASLVDPDDERSLVLDPERPYLLVHAFVPHRSEAVRVMLRDRGDSEFLSLSVPARARGCEACGRREVGARLAELEAEAARLARQAELRKLRGVSALQQIGASELKRQRDEDAWRAKVEEDRVAKKRRKEGLYYEAAQQFALIAGSLTDAILAAGVPVSTAAQLENCWMVGWEVKLGQASLRMGEQLPHYTKMERSLEWNSRIDAPFEIIAYSHIELTHPPTSQRYIGRSHSLWFCDAEVKGTYRWYELAFEETKPDNVPDWMWERANHRQDSAGICFPRRLEPDSPLAVAAFGRHPNGINVVWPFTSLAEGALEDFVDRWITWFARAAKGQRLRKPTIPERNAGRTWRSNGI
jgi:hypothetical protein